MANSTEFDPKNLIRFFVTTFLFSWVIWGIGVVLSNITDYEMPVWLVYPIIIIGAFGPFYGSVSLVYKSGGKEAVLAFLKRGLKIKEVPGLIWLAMFLVPISSMLIAIYIVGLNYNQGGISLTGILIFPIYIIIMYMGGSIQEEYGWRGYALDRMQKKWNALVSSIILGVIWALWHLPLFFISGANQQNMDMGLFLIGTISASIIMTWLHNNSKANIFVAMTFHSIGNAIAIIADLDGVSEEALQAGVLYDIVVTLIVVLLVIIIWGPKRLRRSSPG